MTQSPKKKYMHKIKGSIYHVPSKHKKKEINKRTENKNVLSIQFISSKHKAPETQSHIIFESPSDHPLTYPVKSFRFFFLILTGEYKNTSQFQIIMIHDSVVEVVVHDLTVLQFGFLISATEEVDVVFIVTAIYVTTANQLLNIFK